MIPSHASLPVDMVSLILKRTLLSDYVRAYSMHDEGHGMPGSHRRVAAQSALFDQFTNRTGQ